MAASKRIASKVLIKEVTGKPDGVVVKFGKLDLSSGQAEKLMDLASDKNEVMLTIEPIQENLPGMGKNDK